MNYYGLYMEEPSRGVVYTTVTRMYKNIGRSRLLCNLQGDGGGPRGGPGKTLPSGEFSLSVLDLE